MVYGFVKQSAGHIKIYSEEGHGTTIRMYLPPGSGASPAPRRDRQCRSRAARNHPGGRGRPSGARLCADAAAFARLRHAEGRATPPRRSRSSTQGTRIRPAVHRRDHAGRDERPAARRPSRAARGPALQVLFTSGYTENAIVHHGRLDSGVLLLAKPYRKSDLARMIRKALEAADRNAQLIRAWPRRAQPAAVRARRVHVKSGRALRRASSRCGSDPPRSWRPSFFMMLAR